MRYPNLIRPEGPWLHPLIASESDLYDLATGWDGPLHPGVSCRIVRGHKARSTQHLFDEFAAALQFPYYFGGNWNAFHECLADLEWVSASSLIVVISRAVHLLDEEPQDSLWEFLRLLDRVARERGDAPTDTVGPLGPQSLHVVLHATSGEGDSLRSNLELAGVAYDSLS